MKAATRNTANNRKIETSWPKEVLKTGFLRALRLFLLYIGIIKIPSSGIYYSIARIWILSIPRQKGL
jgi:hypothetical protein